MKEIKIKRILKQILKDYDNIVFREVYNIKNCQTIKYAIKLLNKILVVRKQDYWSSREYK